MQAQDEDGLEETQSRRSGEEKKEGKNIDEQQVETSKLSRVQWAEEERRGEQACWQGNAYFGGMQHHWGNTCTSPGSRRSYSFRAVLQRA